MVSSSQATTASADASDDDANLKRKAGAQFEVETVRSKKTNQNEKHNKLEAIARWIDGGEARKQPDLAFDLQYHSLYKTAFFKLRASVAVKSCSTPEQLSLFMFLPPEIIETLSINRDHAQELGPDTVCLRFSLRSGEAAIPSLIIPKTMDPAHVVWKGKHSNCTWESLRSLARAASFDILCRLPRRTISEARLQSLCNALSSDHVISTPGYTDLGGLYGGKGGKVVRDEVEVEVNSHPSDELLPAYQDLEPGPPMPPIFQGEIFNKRRRGNSDSESRTQSPKPRNDLETTVAWLVTELKEHQAREASLLTELKEVQTKLAGLISEQEEHKAKCPMLDNDLHDRIQGVEARLDELGEELEIRVDCRIDETLDEKSDCIKEELIDYIDDTLPNKIQGALTEVTFSARF